MESGAPSDAMTPALGRLAARAARRYRLERTLAASTILAWVAACGLLALLLAGLVAGSPGFLACLAGVWLFGCLAAAVVIYGWPVDQRRLKVRMDLHARLPDSTLSAGDWDGGPLDPWRQRQREQTVQALEKVTWISAWPVRWPRLVRVPLACAVFLVVGLALVDNHANGIERARQVAAARANAPLPKEQLKPLEAVFADWEEAQKIAPSPEMEKLLKDLQPLREQMAAGTLSQKQLLLKLNDVQARLQAEQDKLDASSLDALAQPMAEAMQDLDAMSGVSAALQRKDYDAASQQTQRAEQQYESGQAKMPEGDNASEAANRLGSAASEAGQKNPEAASAMRQMQGATEQKDSSGMCKSLNALGQCLSHAGQSKSQSHNLSLQMAQLSQCKGGMCHSPGIGMGLPQLSLAKSMSEQHGAGTKTDPNRTGAATQLDGSHQQVAISGTAGAGPSETHTESTTEPRFDRTASGVSAADFSQYQKMSEEAMEDENLPIGHREVIKRYFENIHAQDAR